MGISLVKVGMMAVSNYFIKKVIGENMIYQGKCVNPSGKADTEYIDILHMALRI